MGAAGCAAKARRYFGSCRRRSSGRPAAVYPGANRGAISCGAPMRIVSLVPSATEMLFALGLGEEVAAVTHECDHPPEVLDLRGHARRDRPGPHAGGDRPRGRALTEEGRAIYELDEARLRALQPDLIVTQALCAVCAVSYDDVRALADRMDPRPEVISLDPHTLGEVLGDVRTLAEATDSRDAGVDLVQDAAGADRPRPPRRARRAAGARGRARVARPRLRGRALDASADRVRRRRGPARPARRALRGPRPGRRSPPPGPRSWS